MVVRGKYLVVAFCTMLVLLMTAVWSGFVLPEEDDGFGSFFSFEEEKEEGAGAQAETPPPAPGVPAGYRLAAGEDQLELYVRDTTGQLAVRDLRSGFVWLSTPDVDVEGLRVSSAWKAYMRSTLVIDYTKDKLRRQFEVTDTFSGEPEVAVEDIPGGARFTYDFDYLGLAVSLEYRLLSGNHLEVRIPQKGLREKEGVFVSSVKLLPFLGAQGDDASGYIFYPDGSGALMRFKKSHPTYYEGFAGNVYGLNKYPWDPLSNNHMKTNLPVFGIKVGDSAFAAMVVSGEYDARVYAEPSGYVFGFNRAAIGFVYRHPYRALQGATALDRRLIKGDRVVRYAFLHGDDADYSGMAREYRKHLKAREPGSKRREIEDAIPLELRVFMGVSRRTLFGRKVVVLTSFDEVRTILEALVSRGIDRMNVTLVGWGRQGYWGSYPNRLPPDPAFGGEEGLTGLTKWARKQKARINIYLEDDYVNAFKGNRGFSLRRDVIREPNTNPHGGFDRYLLKPEASLRIAGRDIARLKAYGIQGIEFDEFGNFLMSDGLANSPPGRSDTAQVYTKILKLAGDSGLETAIRNGSAWVLGRVTRVSLMPVRASGYLFEDEPVPFLQMVFHGSALYTGESANLRYDFREQFLRQVEYGAAPVYDVIYRDPAVLRGYEYPDLLNGRFVWWVDAMVDEYKRLSKDMKGILSQEMVSHEKLASGVFVTAYGDGTRVYVNYNSKAYTSGGLRVGGQDYLVRRASR